MVCGVEWHGVGWCGVGWVVCVCGSGGGVAVVCVCVCAWGDGGLVLVNAVTPGTFNSAPPRLCAMSQQPNNQPTDRPTDLGIALLPERGAIRSRHRV